MVNCNPSTPLNTLITKFETGMVVNIYLASVFTARMCHRMSKGRFVVDESKLGQFYDRCDSNRDENVDLFDAQEMVQSIIGLSNVPCGTR